MNGQCEAEGCWTLLREPEVATMSFHNRSRYRKTQSHATGLRRCEWFEQILTHTHCDTRAGICDLESDGFGARAMSNDLYQRGR